MASMVITPGPLALVTMATFSPSSGGWLASTCTASNSSSTFSARSTSACAKAFAAGIDTETPRIALPAAVETQIETQRKPYTAAAFFHFKATGSLERHRAYHAAYEADAVAVDFEADYESGDLTITVERADES